MITFSLQTGWWGKGREENGEHLREECVKGFYEVILKLICLKSNIQSEKFHSPDSHHIIILIAFVKASSWIPKGGLEVISQPHHQEQPDLLLRLEQATRGKSCLEWRSEGSAERQPLLIVPEVPEALVAGRHHRSGASAEQHQRERKKETERKKNRLKRN